MASLVEWAIGLMFTALLVFKVVVPVIKDSINNSTLDTTEKTIAGLVSLFIILSLAYISGAPILGRGE